MTHSTHVSLSLNALLCVTVITTSVAGVFFKYEYFAPILVGVIIGSLLPDIDEPESYIGKRFLPVSGVVNILFGHRGASHYLIAPLTLLLVALFTSGVVSLFFIGLSFGYFFHLIGDMMTLGGIKGFLFPFGQKGKVYAVLPKRFRFRTNSLYEKLIAGILGVSFFCQIYFIYHTGGIR